MNKFFMYILIFFILCFSVNAYIGLNDSYNMDNSNITTQSDSISAYNLLASSTTGMFSSNDSVSVRSVFWNNSVNKGYYNTTFYDISHSSLSINMWIYKYTASWSNGDILFRFLNTSVSNPYMTAQIVNGIAYFKISTGAYITSCNIANTSKVWTMITFTYDYSTNTGKCYINSALGNTTTTGVMINYSNVLQIGSVDNTSIDEVRIYQKELTQTEINGLYKNNGSSVAEIDVTPPFVAISSVNTNVIDGILTAYPNVEGQTKITGYYYVDNNQTTTYKGVICDYNSTQSMQDDFTGITKVSDDGWTGNFTTGIFDTKFGLSYWFNASVNPFSDTTKALPTMTKNMEVSYIIRPQGISTSAFSDMSSDAFISLRTSTGSDVIPIEYVYNQTTSTICLYSYNIARNLIYCHASTITSYINVTVYIDFASSKTYSLKTTVEGQTKYSQPIQFYTTTSQDIGKIYIHPQWNLSLISGTENLYFDNLEVNNVNNQYPILVNANTTNITFPQSILCAFSGINVSWSAILSKLVPQTCTVISSETIYNGNNGYIESCDYSALKCYQTRIYTFTSQTTAYNNYVEYDLCSIKQKATSSSELPYYVTSNNNPNSENPELSQPQKLILLIAIMFVIFIIFFIIGIALNSLKIFLIIGIIADIFLMICATIPTFPLIGGAIPIYIVVILGILSIVLGMYIFIRPSQQTQ
jgi:hypothetical protein